MHRIFLFLLVWFALPLGTVEAVPARPLYEPPQKEQARYDFRGTVWQGKTYEGWVMTIVFEANGGLTYSYQNATHKTGSWKSEGNSLYVEMNNKYCEFRGTLAGTVLEGDSWNVAKLRWKTRLTRIYAPK
jgi:hypothetical protein